jgi:archaellum component FlaC|tara:strand:- start:165 stop:512 length:348 start_codon:yes stop_codon:yes gene_type:complete
MSLGVSIYYQLKENIMTTIKYPETTEEGLNNIIKSQSGTIQEMREEIIRLETNVAHLNTNYNRLLMMYDILKEKYSKESIKNITISAIEKTSKLAYKYVPKLKVANMPSIKIKFK